MNTTAPELRHRWRAEPILGRAYAIYVVGNFLLGLVLVVGGPRRTSSASFYVIREFGGPELWGIGGIALAAAFVAAAAMGRRAILGVLGLATVVHLWLALSFCIAAMVSPDAALTGPVVYMIVAVSQANQALSYAQPAPTTTPAAPLAPAPTAKETEEGRAGSRTEL